MFFELNSVLPPKLRILGGAALTAQEDIGGCLSDKTQLSNRKQEEKPAVPEKMPPTAAEIKVEPA